MRKPRETDMLHSDGRRKHHRRAGQSVPDAGRPETRLWFHFLAASYIGPGLEAILFGPTELMHGNDEHLKHDDEVLGLIRNDPAEKARRHPPVRDSDAPSGRVVRDGKPPMDFQSFPPRAKEIAGEPQEAELVDGRIARQIARKSLYAC